MTVQKHKGANILLADDEPQVLKLLGALLAQGGYTVTIADSGKAAMEVLESQPIDLLILDLSMPPPDGFEILKTLRRKKPGLRILVISGFMHGSLLRASELLGATASLNKADAPKMLLETVETLLS